MSAYALSGQAGAGSHRFGAAVVLSLAAHCAVLTLVPSLRPNLGVQPPGPLQVTFLRPVIETAHEALRALDPSPRRAAEPQLPQPARRRSEAPRIVSPAPAAKAPFPQPSAAQSAPPPVIATPAQPDTAAMVSGPEQPVSAMPPEQFAADVSIREYEAEVRRAISAAVPRRYPRMASDRGWEGRPVVRVRFRKGNLVATLEQPSGFEVLDERAVELTNSSVMPRLPEQLAQHEFEFLLPFDFRLKSR